MNMLFEMQHKIFKTLVIEFSELTAPKWLTSENTVKGSTVDNRWFWYRYVLTLNVGDSVETDFHSITRIM